MKNGKAKKRKKTARMAGVCVAAVLAAGISAAFPGISADAAENSVSEHRAVNGQVSLGQGMASIQIRGNEGQSLEGKTFELFELFHAENSVYGESVNYTFHAEYEGILKMIIAEALSIREKRTVHPSEITEYHVIDYIQSLNTEPVEGAHGAQEPEGRYSEMRDFVEQMRSAIKAQGLDGTKIYVDSVGVSNTVTISGLDYGYYVVDEEAVTSGWSAASLCMTGTANPSVVMSIKSDYPQVVKKIQEDDRLYSVGNGGWNDIGDYEIGQDITYRFETTVCDMNGYDTYYYAWHDRMDPALSFKGEETVSVMISDGEKTYTADSSEYCVITKGKELEEEDTFIVEMKDIKAIIDREFDRIDDRGHNDYSGLKVTLMYKAVLNDLAAEGEGGTGYENHVRLEFSNDPDSDGEGKTGYTLWDTVVCFTFRLNGTKMNEKGTVLADASFLLYSDENCTNEVYVKQNDLGNGYIVINRDSLGGDDHTGGNIPKERTKIVSDVEGRFVIFGLDQGMYYLKEIDAPAGYRLLTEPVVLTVQPVYTADRNSYTAGDGASGSILKELKVSAHIRSFVEGSDKEEDVELHTDLSGPHANLAVVNQIGSRLPVTGSGAMPVLICTGGVLAGGALLAAKCRKKNER